MRNKVLKYAVIAVCFFIVAYNSIAFRKLDEWKASASSKKFDAAGYAHDYLNKKLIPNLDKAIEVNTLVSQIETAKDSTFNAYSHALGIGNIRFFLVRGTGEVKDINENDVVLLVKTDSSQQLVRIATEYVFGNAIRDASGQIDINEFNNTMDFNNVSAEINKVIRSQVLPPFKRAVKKGNVVQFTGALELNQAHPDLNRIEVIPITLKVVS